MKTISTDFSIIAYNTEEYLKQVLNDLVENGVIKKYYYIMHKGETQYDGSTGKNHAHVFLTPNNCSIELLQLQKQFEQIVNGEIESCSIKPNPKSETNNFLLYSKHDFQYLELKEEEKEFHYNWENFKTNDIDSLKRDITSAIKYLKKITSNLYTKVDSLLKQGLKPSQVILITGIKPYDLKQYISILTIEQRIDNKPSQNYLHATDDFQETGEFVTAKPYYQEFANYHIEYYSQQKQIENDSIDKKLKED